MSTYCLRCKRKTGDGMPNPTKTANNRVAMKSTCNDCGCNKSRFLSMNEVKEGGFLGLLGSLFGLGSGQKKASKRKKR